MYITMFITHDFNENLSYKKDLVDNVNKVIFILD